MGLRIDKQALDTLRSLPPKPKRDVRAALNRLSEGEREGLDIKRLDRTPTTLHRLRVGEYRAVFFMEGNRVVVIRIFRREDGYGWLERME